MIKFQKLAVGCLAGLFICSYCFEVFGQLDTPSESRTASIAKQESGDDKNKDIGQQVQTKRVWHDRSGKYSVEAKLRSTFSKERFD